MSARGRSTGGNEHDKDEDADEEMDEVVADRGKRALCLLRKPRKCEHEAKKERKYRTCAYVLPYTRPAADPCA